MTKRAREAGPVKDAAGRWGFVVDLAPNGDGRRQQARRRGFRTRAEAQAVLDELRVDSRQGTYVAPKRQTFGAFLTDEWLPAVKRELAESTFESYARNVRLHIVPAVGGLQLQALDGSVLNRFYGQLLESGRKRGTQSPGLKPRTTRYIATIVHAALDDAVRWRRVPLNAADQATPPSAKVARAPEMTVWSAEELGRFLRGTEGDRYGFPWAFLALTGCRRGEALGLRWRDLDLANGTAALRQQVIPLTKASGRGREGRIVSRTKGGDARLIELDSRSVMTLRAWRKVQAAEKLLLGAGYDDHDLVFARPDGRPFHPEAFSKSFDRRLRSSTFADLPRIRLHDLRHCWATLALKAGVDVKVVSQRLGHSSPVVTWGTYQHVVRGMETDAADRVAALIFGSGAKRASV